MGARVRSVSSGQGRRQRVDPSVGGGRSAGPNPPNSRHSAQVEPLTDPRSREVRNLTPSPSHHSWSHSSPRPAGGPAAHDVAERSDPDADTGRSWQRLGWPDEESEGERIRVSLPEGIPALTPRASRILLDILVQLTTVEVLEALPEDVR